MSKYITISFKPVIEEEKGIITATSNKWSLITYGIAKDRLQEEDYYIRPGEGLSFKVSREEYNRVKDILERVKIRT